MQGFFLGVHSCHHAPIPEKERCSPYFERCVQESMPFTILMIAPWMLIHADCTQPYAHARQKWALLCTCCKWFVSDTKTYKLFVLYQYFLSYNFGAFPQRHTYRASFTYYMILYAFFSIQFSTALFFFMYETRNDPCMRDVCCRTRRRWLPKSS